MDSAPQPNPFQLGGCQSPSGPRGLEVKLKILSQTCCVVSDIVCDTTVVSFVKFVETDSTNEARAIDLNVVGLHCDCVLIFLFIGHELTRNELN